MVDVAEVFEVFDGPVVPDVALAGILISKDESAGFHQDRIYSPLHQKHPGHQPMRDKHTNTREVRLAKTPPQTLIKPTNPIIRIRRTLAIRYAVEEVSIVRSFLPHPLHLATTRLEIAEVLFPQSRLLIHLDGMSAERRRSIVGGRGRCESAQNAFCCFARAAVGGCVELEGVVWF